MTDSQFGLFRGIDATMHASGQLIFNFLKQAGGYIRSDNLNLPYKYDHRDFPSRGDMRQLPFERNTTNKVTGQ